jgi:hypothetical protein
VHRVARAWQPNPDTAGAVVLSDPLLRGASTHALKGCNCKHAVTGLRLQLGGAHSVGLMTDAKTEQKGRHVGPSLSMYGGSRVHTLVVWESPSRRSSVSRSGEVIRFCIYPVTFSIVRLAA